jgi:hypothetical protein
VQDVSLRYRGSCNSMQDKGKKSDTHDVFHSRLNEIKSTFDGYRRFKRGVADTAAAVSGAVVRVRHQPADISSIFLAEV